MVIGKGYITIAVIHDGVDGADGYTVTASPSVITLGINKVSDTEFAADTTKNNTSAIRVFKGNVDVTKTCRVTVSSTENCTATGPFENASGLVKVTRMSTYTAGGVTYPFTTGSVTVAINTGSSTLSHTVAVNVDMSVVWGGVETTVRGLKSEFGELQQDLQSEAPNVLTKYTSKIEQTAREIALKVGQTAVGRKNLLVGSALCRQGKGVVMTIGGESGIERLGGVDDVNCWHGVAAAQETVTLGMDAAAGGYNVRVENGKKYTMSAWVKVTDARAVVFYRVGFRASADSTTDVNTLTDHVLTSAEKTSAWQLVTWTWEMPQSVSASYARVLFGMTNGTAGTTMGVWICQPMLQEGDGYTGWCLSEQDYKYVGGNMLDNTRTLEKRGNMVTRNGTVTAEGYGGCATIEATAGSNYIDMLQWQCKDGFVLNEDYTLSFMAKGSGRINGYMYHGTGIRMRCENSDGLSRTDVRDGSSTVTLTSEWRRYWIHWRNKGTGKADYMLLRLLSGGTATIAQPKLEVGANMTDWLEGSATLTEDRSVEARLLDTGIDIKHKTIDMTADKFTLRNNHGEKSFGVDEDGNLEARSLKSVSKDGLLTAVIKDGAFTALSGLSGATAFFGLIDGLPYLQFTNAAGMVCYAIGPSGGQAMGNIGVQMVTCGVTYSVSTMSLEGKSNYVINYSGSVTLQNFGSESVKIYQSKLLLVIDGFTHTFTTGFEDSSFPMTEVGQGKVATIMPGLLMQMEFKMTPVVETMPTTGSDGSGIAVPSGARGCHLKLNGVVIGKGAIS